MAQDGNDAATEQRQLDEIIVTAQKKEESVQDIPISINALSGDFLLKNNISDFGNLELFIPGLDINETSPNGNNFSLREIPNAGSFIGLSSVMDTYWNGIVLPSELALGAMFDMERVEVLRGPQGALQGRPAPAGVMLLHSKRPDVEQISQLEGNVRSKVRDDGGYDIEAGISMPLISDELAIRVAGFWRDDDGRADYVNNSGKHTERKNKAARITLAWQPTENFSATLITQFDDRDELGGANYYTGNGELGFVSPYENSRTPNDFDDYQRKYTQNALDLQWDFGGHRLTSLSGYGTSDATWDVDFTQSTTADLYLHMTREREHLTQEFRFESMNRENWEYMVGVYYSDSKLFFRLLPSIFDATDEQYGVFTFHKFNITEETNLQLGLRWQHYESFRETNPIVFTDSSPTWSAQLSHHFNDDVMGYLSYQRGFRSQGGIRKDSELSSVSNEFYLYDEEVSDSFEVGVKSELFDGRLMLNANIYHQDFSGFPQATGGVATDVNLDGVFDIDN